MSEPVHRPPPDSRILLVDDDTDFVESLSELLDQRGLTTAIASSSQEALGTAARWRPQMALIDVRLGLESGIDLMAELRDQDPELLCVLMTAYGSVDATLQALRNGAYDFLLKPLNFSELFKTLERGLQHVMLQQARHRAEHQLAERNTRLRRINQQLGQIVAAATRMAACSEETRLSHQLLTELGLLMRAGGGSVYLGREQHLDRIASLDPEPHAPSTLPLPLAPGSLFGRALGAGEPVVADVRKMEHGATSGWGGYRNSAAVIFPLGDGDHPGVLSVHDLEDPAAVTEDLSLARLLVSFFDVLNRTVHLVDDLQRSEGRLADVLAIAPDPIVTLDGRANIALFNRRAEEVFEISAEQARGSSLRMLVAEHDWERVERLLSVLGTSKRRQASIEADCRSAQGRTFAVEMALAAVPAAGSATFTCILRDISARRQREAERARSARERQQAEKMQALGRLAGGIAHDFNNLLSTIMLICDVAASTYGGDDATELIEDLGTIQESAQRLAELTRQLLSFSRPGPEPDHALELNGAIVGLRSMLDRLIGEHITLQLDLVDGTLPILLAPSSLDQIVVNLVANARDAISSSGGLIRIQTRQEGSPPRAILRVTDNGHGIDAASQDRIFEPFYTTKAIGRGTGLGLATVFSAVQRAGGLLDVQSQPGSGTTITVSLPRCDLAPEDAPREAPAPLPSLQGRTVLVVEDEAELGAIISRVLTDAGATVLVAARPSEALLLSAQHPGTIDLLLTDIVLPEMSGFVLAEQLEQSRPLAAVVFMSGYLSESVEAVDVPGEVFLSKPFKPAELLTLLAQAIERGSR